MIKYVTNMEYRMLFKKNSRAKDENWIFKIMYLKEFYILSQKKGIQGCSKIAFKIF